MSSLSDQIRRVAKEKYVDPAVQTGRKEFSIPVRGMLDSLLPAGFPSNHTAQICSSIQSLKFLKQNGLQIGRIDGPPSGKSPTVVVHYRVAGRTDQMAAPRQMQVGSDSAGAEERAKRLASGLRGLLSKELAEYGGAEAFVQWVRSDEPMDKGAR